MSKLELVKAVASQTGLTQLKAKEAVESVLSNIASGVRSEKKLSLPGFGNFKVETRAARTGRNPQTGAPLQIAAKEVVKFKAQF